MKKNFIYNLIYQVLILILPIITMPYISRVLGADGIGIYSYTHSIAYYFMLIAMLGLNHYGNRTIAKARDSKENLSKNFWGIYLFQLITSTFMVSCYLIYVLFFCKEYKTIALIQVMHIIASMFDINWFFFGIEKFKLTITRNTIIKILSLILIFLFVKKPDDVWIYTVILSGSSLFSNLMLFAFLRKYIKPVKIEKRDITKHIKPNLIMFLPVIAVSIYKMMDKVMLGIISNVSEVGYYENAEKITNVSITIITALGTVTLPRVSNMISNNKIEEVKKLIKKTMPFAMFLTFPITLGVICISNDFSVLFFGQDFAKSGYLIQLLSITTVFLSWGNVIRTQYLIPTEKDKAYIVSAFMGAIVNFTMNSILIPRFASAGACFGTIAAEFIVMMYQTFAVRKDLHILEYIKKSLPFLIKAIVMFLIIVFIGQFISNRTQRLIIQITTGMMFYFALNAKYILYDLNIKNFLYKIREESFK